MCSVAISLASKALAEVSNAEIILKLKTMIALFIQTMEVWLPKYLSLPEAIITDIQGWGYSVSRLDEFLVDLFDKYADLLKRRFSEDFQEVSRYSMVVAVCQRQKVNHHRSSPPMTTCPWPSTRGRSTRKLLTSAGSRKTRTSKTSREF